MSNLDDRLRYVDVLAPEHCRKSCSDSNVNNYATDADNLSGYGRCYRCTLLKVATSGISEVTDD